MKQLLLIALAAVGTFSLTLRENQPRVSFETIVSHMKDDREDKQDKQDKEGKCLEKKCLKQLQGCSKDQGCVGAVFECAQCNGKRECEQDCVHKHDDKKPLKNLLHCAEDNKCNN